MAKLVKQCWISAKGIKKVNCYKATIPKELVEKLGLQDREVEIKIEGNKIVIDRK